jgi:hypothetical protein
MELGKVLLGLYLGAQGKQELSFFRGHALPLLLNVDRNIARAAEFRNPPMNPREPCFDQGDRRTLGGKLCRDSTMIWDKMTGTEVGHKMSE